MTLYATPETTTATNPWRMRYGFVAFAIATPLLWLIACNPLFGHSCYDGNPFAAAWCAALIEVALLVIVFRKQGGWRFSGGFFAAFIIVATFTRGRATEVWLAPMRRAITSASPVWAPVVARQERSAAESDWIGNHRASIPIIVHGARLVAMLHECLEQARAADSTGSYPRNAEAIGAQPGCEVLPKLALDAEGIAMRFTDEDNGWRWTYIPAAAGVDGKITGYSVRALEDPVLEKPRPQFSGDESGIVVETKPGSPPAIVDSPVASLVMLRRCLTRVPAYNAKRSIELQRWASSSPALQIVGQVCPELRGHIGTDPYGESRQLGMLALPVHEQAGEFTDTAAVYSTVFVPADIDGMIFELHATPRRVRNPGIRSGIRRFFVARDGSVHVRTGGEAAAITDPIAPECLPGGGVDCSISQGAVVPAPGS